jgi:hypothetical protein
LIEQLHHTAIIKRLDTIANRAVNWRMILLVAGVMLWYGYAIGPVLVAAWAIELTLSVVLAVVAKYRSG